MLESVKKIQDRSNLFNLFSLWIFGIFFFFSHRFSIGIDGHDESLYLFLGHTKNFIFDWSPIYTSHYRLLSLFTKDLIFLYDLNQFLVCCIYLPSSIYILLSHTGFKKIYALICSLILLMSRSNLAAMPHVHVFNFSLIIFLFNFIFLKKSIKFQLLFFYLLGFSLFSRQENFIFGLISYLGFIFLIKKYKSKILPWIILPPMLFFLGFKTGEGIWGNPFQARGFNAFRDHFVWRNPELAQSHKEFKAKYPLLENNESMTSFITSYPTAFGIHFLKNLRDLPGTTIKTLFSKKLSFHDFSFSLFLFNFFYICSFFFVFWTGPKINLGKEDSVFLFILTFGFFSQGAFSSLIFQPFDKYLFAAGFSLMIFLIFFTRRFISFAKIESKEYLMISLCVFSIASFFNFFFSNETFSTRPNLERLKLDRTAKSFGFNRSDQLLLTDRTLLYLPENYSKIQKTMIIFSYFQPPYYGTNFQEFIAREKINVFCHTPDDFSKGVFHTFGYDSNLIDFLKNKNFSQQFFVGDDFYTCYRFLY